LEGSVTEELVGVPGWPGGMMRGRRPTGVHPLASIGGPPEHRDWKAGDAFLEPNIHPSALVHAFCTVDGGMTYKPTTSIGARSFLMARCHIGHNAVLGDDVELGAGVVICGEVEVGHGVRIGGNSWVKPLVKIGEGAIIGGGAVVTKDVPAHEVWAGNPARFMKRADTHPQVVGFKARLAEKANYAMTEAEWEHARAAAYGRHTNGNQPAHPLREPDEVWAYMAPWHRRDLERRHPELRELDDQRHAAYVRGDWEAATTLLNKHEAVTGRLGALWPYGGCRP
jgi:acetyltransferase-like isoleucine patch superfamily enzyme